MNCHCSKGGGSCDCGIYSDVTNGHGQNTSTLTIEAIVCAAMAAVMLALFMPETWVLLAELVQLAVPGLVLVAGQ